MKNDIGDQFFFFNQILYVSEIVHLESRAGDELITVFYIPKRGFSFGCLKLQTFAEIINLFRAPTGLAINISKSKLFVNIYTT